MFNKIDSEFKSLGFQFELEENLLKITSVPNQLKNNSIEEIIDDILDNDNDFDKKLIKIVDVTGREQKSIIKNKVLFLIFDDGTVEKQFIN